MESLNMTIIKNKKENPLSDSKGSLFITSDEKVGDYSSLLHSFNKKNKNSTINEQSFLDITNKSKQGLLPRIKQNINNEMMK
jgi:hypothetical protein